MVVKVISERKFITRLKTFTEIGSWLIYEHFSMATTIVQQFLTQPEISGISRWLHKKVFSLGPVETVLHASTHQDVSYRCLSIWQLKSKDCAAPRPFEDSHYGMRSSPSAHRIENAFCINEDSSNISLKK